jgi:hypothetical protein
MVACHHAEKFLEGAAEVRADLAMTAPARSHL